MPASFDQGWPKINWSFGFWLWNEMKWSRHKSICFLLFPKFYDYLLKNKIYIFLNCPLLTSGPITRAMSMPPGALPPASNGDSRLQRNGTDRHERIRYGLLKILYDVVVSRNYHLNFWCAPHYDGIWNAIIFFSFTFFVKSTDVKIQC